MFNESYKLIAKNMDKAGSLTVLVETIAGILSLFLIPFFEIKFPSDIRIYLLKKKYAISEIKPTAAQ